MVGRGLAVALSLLMLLLLMLLLPAADAQAHEAPVLYLADQESDQSYYNFTSLAPDADDDTRSIQPIQTQFRAAVTWRVFKLPGPWILEADQQARVTVFLQGLDQLHPAPDVRPAAVGDLEQPIPEVDPNGVGKISVTARLLKDGDTRTPMAQGRAYHLPDPTAAADALYRFEIGMPYQPMTLAAEPEAPNGMTLVVEISGRNVTNISPIRFLLGSQAAPARLEVPGFPMALFETTEAALLEERACRVTILTGGSCGPVLQQAGDSVVARESSDMIIIAVGIVVFGTAIVAGMIKRRIFRRSPARR